MAYKVILLSHAVKDFEALSPKEKSHVAEALRALAEFSIDLTHVKKLQLPLRGYRKRVGNYRILFDIEDHTIHVHAIRHRKDAYR